MSKEFTKEDVIQNKKEAIKCLNNLLEFYINDSSMKRLKKAHLISYWIKNYVRLINFEETFDPRNIKGVLAGISLSLYNKPARRSLCFS